MAKGKEISEAKKKRLSGIYNCRMIVSKVSCSGRGSPVNLEGIFADCLSGLTRERLQEYLDFGVGKKYLIEEGGFYSVSKRGGSFSEFRG